MKHALILSQFLSQVEISAPLAMKTIAIWFLILTSGLCGFLLHKTEDNVVLFQGMQLIPFWSFLTILIMQYIRKYQADHSKQCNQVLLYFVSELKSSKFSNI